MAVKIGILGGTFDPIHLAHLRVAEEVREGLSLSEIWFIPAGLPPHKQTAPHLPFEVRLQLVKLAIEDHPAFRALDIEGRREGPSYTVDTLRILRKRHPGYEFYFILGLDAFLEIESWHEYQRLPELARLVVINRGSQSLEEAQKRVSEIFPETVVRQRIIFFAVTPLGVSSTLIRDLLRQGKSIRYLVPESVRKYLCNFTLLDGKQPNPSQNSA